MHLGDVSGHSIRESGCEWQPGVILQGAIDTFNWQEAATVLLAILVLVIIGEFVAMSLRKRII